MISIIMAIGFSILAFTHYPPVIASICSLCFALAAAFSNYIFRPRAHNISFNSKDYKLSGQFELKALEDGEYTRKIINKQGYELVLFKSFGRDGREAERKLPRDLVRLIYSKENVIKLYSAKKTIKGNLLVSVLKTTYGDLKAEILSTSKQCCFSSDSKLLKEEQ